MLIAMAGLPATGKSAIARRLAAELPAVVLDKDRIRAALFAPPDIEYSREQDDLCMHVMLQVAEFLLGRDPTRHVILDGRTFSRRYQLEACQCAALRLGTAFRVLECVCAQETARQRLELDVAAGRHVAANRDYAIYLEVRSQFEPILLPKLVLDTDLDVEQCVARALRYLRSGDAGSVA